ncbi:MAG: hypothetical protein L0Y66_13380 [Myxococcaceae bacterium]|nr:hypothetical protein [Myxococcaceae bacterium]MCI0671574.1 hypothetical protein [Myxococcaceae bacterium]
MAALLERHLQRLEDELARAEEHDDAADAARLRVLMERQRGRLAVIREEAERLSAQVQEATAASVPP